MQAAQVRSLVGELRSYMRRAVAKKKKKLQARREWYNIFKVWKEKTYKRISYPARLSFRFERQIKNFTDKQKLKEFGTTKSGLQEMLKELLLAEKITTRNIKIMKGKSTLVKANIQ